VSENLLCELCRETPAEQILLQSASSRIIWWQHQKIEAPLCGMCAEQVYYNQQSRTLIQGWWGPLSALATIWFSLSNKYRISKHRKALQTINLNGKIVERVHFNVRRNTFAMIVTVGVIGGLAFFVFSDTSDSSGQSSLGSCYQDAGVDKLQSINCSDSGADYRVSAIVETINDCPGYSTNAGDNYACLEELR
jgi:hypothetical protein